jgi:NADPH:quinone reductase-like Zn-dependent oxidoreductase
VAVLNAHGGNWQEQAVVPARQVVPVADGIPDKQAAMFFVNPASALIMTRFVLNIPAGAWLLQTAAGSALGRMVQCLGQYYGFRTINVVRRRPQAEELLAKGADAVICTADEIIEERVEAITGGKGAPFGLDAVGGATGAAVLRALAPGGRLLVYGTLSGEPLPVDPRALITGPRHVEGFWLSNWVRGQGPIALLRLFRRLNKLLAMGVLTSEIAATFPLADIHAAVQQAERGGRGGKILLRITEQEPGLGG